MTNQSHQTPAEDEQHIIKILDEFDEAISGTPPHWEKSAERIRLEKPTVQALISWHHQAVNRIANEIIGEDYPETDDMIPSARLASAWRNDEHDIQRSRLAAIEKRRQG